MFWLKRTEIGPGSTFNHFPKEYVIKETKNLDVPNASQEDYIATKVVKENSDIFSNFICLSFNNMIDVYIFLALLKLAIITSV